VREQLRDESADRDFGHELALGVEEALERFAHRLRRRIPIGR